MEIVPLTQEEENTHAQHIAEIGACVLKKIKDKDSDAFLVMIWRM